MNKEKRKEIKDTLLKKITDEIEEIQANIVNAKKRYDEEIEIWQQKLDILQLKAEALDKLK